MQGSTNPLYNYANIEPSAPPLSEYDIEIEEKKPLKIVQPFQIVSTSEAYPVTVIDESMDTSSSSTAHVTGHRKTRDKTHGRAQAKLQSAIIDSKVAQGNTDGFRIVHEDRITAHRSTTVGMKESAHLDRRIEAGNDDDVEDIDVADRLVANPSADSSIVINPNRSDISKYTDGKQNNEYKLPDYGGTGYQIPEYKSMYEDGNGTGTMKYEFQDYKSIYD